MTGYECQTRFRPRLCPQEAPAPQLKHHRLYRYQLGDCPLLVLQFGVSALGDSLALSSFHFLSLKFWSLDRGTLFYVHELSRHRLPKSLAFDRHTRSIPLRLIN